MKQLLTLYIKTLSVLYLSLGGINLLCEGHSLLLRADHASDRHVLGELQFGDALKALLQVGLHTQWVFGL